MITSSFSFTNKKLSLFFKGIINIGITNEFSNGRAVLVKLLLIVAPKVQPYKFNSSLRDSVHNKKHNMIIDDTVV